MKYLNKYIYIIVGILYFIYIFTLGILVFNKNDLGYVTINNKTYISIKYSLKNTNHKNNDLIVIEKKESKDIKIGDEIYIVTTNNGIKSLFVGKVKEAKDNKYLVKNDSKYYDYNDVLGVLVSEYSNMGEIFSFLASDFSLILTLIVGILIVLIIKVKKILINLKKNVITINSKIGEINSDNKNVQHDTTKVEEQSLPIKNDNYVVPYIYEEEIIMNNNSNENKADIYNSKIQVKHINKNTELNVKKIETVEEDIKEEEKENEIKDNKIVVGNDQNNLIYKYLDLKFSKIKCIIMNLAEFMKVNINQEALDNSIKYYIDLKYIKQIELDKSIDKKEKITKELKNYVNKYTELDKIEKENIINYILYFDYIEENNELDTSLANIFSDTSKEELVFIKKIINNNIDKFNNIYDKFISKINNSNIFRIKENDLGNNLIYCQLESNIDFEGMFSDNLVKKSYDDNLVMMNLYQVFIKLLCGLLIKDLNSFNYDKKYLYKINELLLKNQNLLYEHLKNISDAFSQNKVLLMMNYNMIVDNYNLVLKLLGLGYKFSIVVNLEDITNDKYDKDKLLIASKIYIIANSNEFEFDNYIPLNVKDKVEFIEKDFDKEVIENDSI